MRTIFRVLVLPTLVIATGCSSGPQSAINSATAAPVVAGLCGNSEFVQGLTDLTNYVNGFDPLDPDQYDAIWLKLFDLADVAEREQEPSTASRINAVADDVIEAQSAVSSALESLSVSELTDAEELAGLAADGIREVVRIC